MESFDINELMGLQGPHYQNEHIHNPIGGLSSPFDPPNLFPNSVLSHLTTPPSTDSTGTFSSSLTPEEEAHVDNLLFFGVDSPILPPDILTLHPANVWMTPALYPMLPEHPRRMDASSVSPVRLSSSLFSPTTVGATFTSASRSVQGGSGYLANTTSQFGDPTPGPSAPRVAQRSRAFYPGESSFHLNPPTVVPQPPSQSVGQVTSRPGSRLDYSACPCPDRLTSNRARHWRSCPYNPERSLRRLACETCGKMFTRGDNKKRHTEAYH